MAPANAEGGDSMKTLAMLASITIAQLIACAAVAAEPAVFSNAVLRGSYNCAMTAFSLPARTRYPFLITAKGVINAVADGNGKWTSGSFDEKIDVPHFHAACKLTIASGTYTVNSNGTGFEDIKWQLLKDDSSSACQMFFPDTDEVPTTTQLIVLDTSGETFYMTSLSQFAILATVCEK
jgi:hypothetical protein